MDAASCFVLSHHLPIQQWLWRGRQMPTKTHHLCGPQLLKGLGSFATRVVCGGTHCAAICAADRSSEQQLLQQLLQQLDWKGQKHKSTLSTAVVREEKNKKEGKRLGRPSKLLFSRPLQQYRAKLAQQAQKKKRTELKLRGEWKHTGFQCPWRPSFHLNRCEIYGSMQANLNMLITERHAASFSSCQMWCFGVYLQLHHSKRNRRARALTVSRETNC